MILMHLDGPIGVVKYSGGPALPLLEVLMNLIPDFNGLLSPTRSRSNSTLSRSSAILAAGMVSSPRHERYPRCLRPSEHDGRPGTLSQTIREGRLRAHLSPLRNTAGETKNSLLILWICQQNLPLWVMIDAVVMFVRLFCRSGTAVSAPLGSLPPGPSIHRS